MARVRALQHTQPHVADELGERVHAEIMAMFAHRARVRDAVYERTLEIRKADGVAMLWCPLRATSVIGVNTDRLPFRGRPCFLCGSPLPPRRTRWCSDPCWQLWFANHEWQAASFAAKRRDQQRCVRCSADAEEVNHIDPRYGRGYHQGCHNHLDRLESLCHVHHVVETNRQRAERATP
jgi:hypothetical protein